MSNLNKVFNTTDNVGNARYVVNFHNGVKKHTDGSDFYDLRIFRNKLKRDEFINALIVDGYKEV